MFSNLDKNRNQFMLTGSFKRKGYDWWWHSFTAKNAVTGEEKPFFIEYFTCNPALGKKDPIFGQLPTNRKKKPRPSYMMVKAGAWGEGRAQLHRFFGWKSVNIKKGVPYEVSAEDCYASDYRLCGSVRVSKEDALAHPEWMCDAGEMSWDLKLDKQIAFNVGYGAGSFFRFLKAFEMYWHAEGMKTLYSGTVNYNGEKYIVEKEGSFGYADKNWGSNFTSPWVWLSSNSMKSKITGKVLNNSVFDIGGGRPKVFGIALERKLLGGFYYEGKELDFNFSKFWTSPKTEFSSEETDDKIIWDVKQSNRKYVMEIHAECLKKDMLLVNYESPDGKKRHNRLWNGGNGTGNIKIYKKSSNSIQTIVDDIEVKRIGCEYGEYCD